MMRTPAAVGKDKYEEGCEGWVFIRMLAMSDRVEELLALADEDGSPHSRAYRRELVIIMYRVLRRLPVEQRRRLKAGARS